MKISEKYKVREMAGEHIIVMPGRYGADMTRVVALNATSLYLWEQLAGREFDLEEVVRLLVEQYEIDPERFLSKGRSTPYQGARVYGQCLATVYSGRAVYLDEELIKNN